MFINISNHLLSSWGENQLKSAKQLASIGNPPILEELQFPIIDPEADEATVGRIAKKLCDRIVAMINHENAWTHVVHLMGETTLVVMLTKMLHHNGIKVVVSTTKRNVVEKQNADGTVTKVSKFEFIKFRQIAPQVWKD